MHHKLLALTLVTLVPTLACKRDEPTETPTGDSVAVVPTAHDVCRHLSKLIVAEIGPVDPSVEEQTVRECVVEMEAERQLRGEQEWTGVANCVLASNNEADIDRCDQLYPGPTRPDASAAREEEACLRMLEVILTEAAAAGEIDIDAVTDEQLREMNDECLGAFAEDKQAMDPAEYERMLDCILAAPTVEQMQSCA